MGETHVVGGRIGNDYGFWSQEVRPSDFEMHGRGSLDGFLPGFDCVKPHWSAGCWQFPAPPGLEAFNVSLKSSS
jgi:hypothetical protein